MWSIVLGRHSDAPFKKKKKVDNLLFQSGYQVYAAIIQVISFDISLFSNQSAFIWMDEKVVSPLLLLTI